MRRRSRGHTRPAARADVEGMARAVADFLDAARVPIPAADRKKTPERVAEAWASDLISGYGRDPVAEMSWEAAPAGEGIVVLRDIPFASTCVHHLIPFTGRAHLAYLPGARLAGLSKLVRVVDVLSRRLQVQERLTEEIIGAIERALAPKGAAVMVVAEHLCVSCRGVRKPGIEVVTTRLAGRFRAQPLRAEVIGLLGAPAS